VLDVGCGDGRYGRLVRSAGATVRVGLDTSAAMLDRARAAGGAALAAGDMAQLPFRDHSFDTVVHVLTLGHGRDCRAPLVEAGRVLAPEGRLLLVDLHPAAADRGWRRTFRDATGRSVEVAWFPHALGEVFAGLAAAGLRAELLVEPGLDPDRLDPRAPAAALGGPALYGLRARREPSTGVPDRAGETGTMGSA
jgi:SAM-dependent methyltransferase